MVEEREGNFDESKERRWWIFRVRISLTLIPCR